MGSPVASIPVVHLAPGTSGRWDIAAQVVEVMGDKLSRMIKNTLIAQGRNDDFAAAVEVFFECNVTFPVLAEGGHPRTFTVRTSVEFSDQSSFDVCLKWPAMSILTRLANWSAL